jgi:hypothetical protein
LEELDESFGQDGGINEKPILLLNKALPTKKKVTNGIGKRQ